MSDSEPAVLVAAQNAPAHEAPESKTFSGEYVAELRNENATWRRKASGHESAAQQAKAEAEKARAEAEKVVAEARSAADQRVIRAELKAAALKAGIVDLDGLKLLNTSDVKLDEEGEVVIPDGFFDNARKAKPWLFGQATTSQTSPAPRQESPKTKSAHEMTDAEMDEFARRHGIRV
jgi:hypothetical protein